MLGFVRIYLWPGLFPRLGFVDELGETDFSCFAGHRCPLSPIFRGIRRPFGERHELQWIAHERSGLGLHNAGSGGNYVATPAERSHVQPPRVAVWAACSERITFTSISTKQNAVPPEPEATLR